MLQCLFKMIGIWLQGEKVWLKKGAFDWMICSKKWKVGEMRGKVNAMDMHV